MRLVPGMLVAVLLVLPGVSHAQPAPVPPGSRFFVEVNFLGSANSLAESREFTSFFRQFGEVGSTESRYPKPTLANPFAVVDFGGGIMFIRGVGMGVTVSRTTFEDVAGLEATIPHPSILNAPSTATGETNAVLERHETATHLFLALVPINTSRYQLRFFGGPTWFSYSAQMVRDVAYEFSGSNLTITGSTANEAEGSALGYHLGGDFTYFFSKRFGIASGIRYSRGTVTVDREPLSTIAQEIRVGSNHVYLGARFRFGS